MLYQGWMCMAVREDAFVNSSFNSLGFVDQVFEQYCQDPDSVHPSWREVFAGETPPVPEHFPIKGFRAAAMAGGTAATATSWRRSTRSSLSPQKSLQN